MRNNTKVLKQQKLNLILIHLKKISIKEERYNDFQSWAFLLIVSKEKFENQLNFFLKCYPEKIVSLFIFVDLILTPNYENLVL